ncbi:MAG: hypothetical protein H7707_00035, partial [Acetobacter sp.]|nr:hypothetical protein [Acetobacter sp.]
MAPDENIPENTSQNIHENTSDIPPNTLQKEMLDCLFRQARTPLRWTDRPLDEAVLQTLYDVVCLGPTSANCSPARFVFITTQKDRERIRPALSAGNMSRVMAAPLIVIVEQVGRQRETNVMAPEQGSPTAAIIVRISVISL